jgi:hypothetical protein
MGATYSELFLSKRGLGERSNTAELLFEDRSEHQTQMVNHVSDMHGEMQSLNRS